MKKTKLLTSIAALALVASLGACTTGDIIIDVGGVDLDVDVDSTESTETSESTESSESSESSDSTETSGGDTSTPTPEPDPDPEPETDYWSNHLTEAQLNSAKELLGCDIDDVLPYVLPEGLDLDFYVSTQVAITESSYSQYIDGVQETWVEALTAFGYEQSGSDYYYNDYRVTLTDNSYVASNMTSFLIGLYPPEQSSGEEETKIDSWAKLLSSSDYQNFAAVFGKEIESVLPFYAPNESAELGGYTSASLSTGAATLTLTATPISSGQSSAELDNNWGYILGQFGYSATHNGSQTTYVLNGFQVVTNYDSSSFSFVFSKYVEPEQEPGDSDLDIAEAILDAASDGVNWDAFHGEYIDEGWEDTETTYLTEDDDGAYGSVVDYEEDDVTFAYYYQNGKEYSYAANRKSYAVDDQWGDEYEDYLEYYTDDVLDGVEDFDLDSDSYQLKEYGDGYELIITVSGYMGYYEYEYIYIVDGDLNVVALAYGEYFAGDLEGYYAEETTYEQVAASMTDFNPALWGEDTKITYEENDLNDMIAEINENHNYEAISYFYLYQSDAVSVDYQGSVSMSAVARYATDIYATKDACLIQYLQYMTGSSGTGWYYVDVELYVNDYVNNLTEVYYINGSSIYSLGLAGYYYGTWEDNIGNLGDLMDDRDAITTDWSLYGYSEYDIDSSAYEDVMNATIANTYLWDSAFGSYGFNRYMNGASDFSYAVTDTIGFMTSGFVGAEFSFDSGVSWWYTDYTYQYIFAQEGITYTDIVDLGTTEIPSGYASYL